jgi:hypothetical protein
MGNMGDYDNRLDHQKEKIIIFHFTLRAECFWAPSQPAATRGMNIQLRLAGLKFTPKSSP